MAKAKNSFDKMAADAARRLDQARDAGAQLTFLPDEDGSALDLAQDNPVGRPKGAKNKVSNQMRDWLASKGMKMPEEVLAQMAGLASRDDAVLTAMQNAERVLAWAFDGATQPKRGGGTVAVTPSGAQRMNVFIHLYTVQLRAADALLPYGAPKATPDVVQQQVVNISVPAAPSQAADPAASAKDVTPRMKGRMIPADVRRQNEQNQEVSGSTVDSSDSESRTE